jgi:hypothetical protein
VRPLDLLRDPGVRSVSRLPPRPPPSASSPSCATSIRSRSHCRSNRTGASALPPREELFSAYLPSPRRPVFMSLIEKTFGKELTTRTWDTVAKVARA